MPGRSPYEAFVAFVDPLASAIGSIVRAKFRCSSGGKTDVQANDDEPDHRLFLGTDRPTRTGDQTGQLRVAMLSHWIACRDSSTQ